MNNEQFARGIEEFNRGFFFECHDTLEDLWHGTRGHDRLFLQGLIQVSVGFYHFLNSNYKGAVSQFTRGLEKLDKYRPNYMGLDLDDFTRKVLRWLVLGECALRGEEISINEATIPKIRSTTTILKGE